MKEKPLVLHGQEVTREQMLDFKQRYEEALAKGLSRDDTYDYYGQELLVGYARHVVEYAERHFGPLAGGG